MTAKRNPLFDTSLPAERGARKRVLQHRGRAMTADEEFLKSLRKEQARFTSTDPWRIFRILSEFVEGFEALAELGPAITLFGSARVPEKDPMYKAAQETARLLSQTGFSIITGGGPGIMEAGNRGAQEGENGESVGLNIELPFEQSLNPYVDINLQFHYFFVRKTLFLKYAEGFVIFPGGFGTMDELFESMTLIQTGKVRNFPVVLFNRDYWTGLVNWLRDTMAREGKIEEADLDLFFLTDDPQEAVDHLAQCISENTHRDEKEENAREATQSALSRDK